MVRTVETFRTKDGKTFNFKNAANMHERVLKLQEEIKKLPIPTDAKKYLYNNWDNIQRLCRRFDNITPDARIRDVHNPAALMESKAKVDAPKAEKKLRGNKSKQADPEKQSESA